MGVVSFEVTYNEIEVACCSSTARSQFHYNHPKITLPEISGSGGGKCGWVRYTDPTA